MIPYIAIYYHATILNTIVIYDLSFSTVRFIFDQSRFLILEANSVKKYVY